MGVNSTIRSGWSVPVPRGPHTRTWPGGDAVAATPGPDGVNAANARVGAGGVVVASEYDDNTAAGAS